MAESFPQRKIEDIYADLQLRLINQRLRDIKERKDNRYKPRPQDSLDVELVHRQPQRNILSANADNMEDISPHHEMHRYGTRLARPHHLDAMDYRPMPPEYQNYQRPPPAPPPIIVQQPAAQPQQPQPQPPNPRAEVMDMLLLQGAQMHQAVMQQLMLSSIRPHQPPSTAHPAAAPQQPGVSSIPPVPLYDRKDVLVPLSLVNRLHNSRRSPRSRRSTPDSQPDREQNRDPLIPLSLATELLDKRPRSVHHYHNGSFAPPDVSHQPPPPEAPPDVRHQPSPRTLTPEILGRTLPVLPPVKSPSWSNRRPVEVAHLTVPKVSRPTTPLMCPPSLPRTSPTNAQEEEALQTQEPDDKDQEPRTSALTFPGPKPLRRFRHAAYVAQFICRLQLMTKKNKMEEDFIFGIRVKEICQAAHRFYSEETGPLTDHLKRVTIQGASDLAKFIHGGTQSERKKLYGRVMDILHDIINVITNMMPQTGMLEVGHRSALYQLVQTGGLFPAGYLWEIDEDLLSFDGDGRIKDVEETDAVVLILGSLVGRGLVTMTLLQSGSALAHLSVSPGSMEDSNLRVLGSLLMAILIGVYNHKQSSNQQVAFPREITKLFTQEQLQPFLTMKESAMKKEQKKLRNWAAEYYKKIVKLKKSLG